MYKISAPRGSYISFIEKVVSEVAGVPMEVSQSPGAVYIDPEKPNTHFIWEMQPKGGQNG